MATFTSSEPISAAMAFKIEDDGRVVLLNGKGTVRASMAQVQVEVTVPGEPSTAYTSRRCVITAPHGVKILPYINDEKGVRVVLVEQFRIALGRSTLEPPGGEADHADPRVSMAQELEEEVRIHVDPDEITVVFAGLIQPSMMASMSTGGVVEIAASRLPAELLGGEHRFGEYTVVTVVPLRPLMEQVRDGSLVVDLETLLLLHALAGRTLV